LSQKLCDLAPLQEALFAMHANTSLKKARLAGLAQHLGIIVRLIGIPIARCIMTDPYPPCDRALAAA
jgi:hypothetical protein